MLGGVGVIGAGGGNGGALGSIVGGYGGAAMGGGGRGDVAGRRHGVSVWGGEGGEGVMGRDAVEGKGPRRPPQRRSDRRLEEVAEAVGGGFCRLKIAIEAGTWRLPWLIGWAPWKGGGGSAHGGALGGGMGGGGALGG